jgi:hypothetical protein
MTAPNPYDAPQTALSKKPLHMADFAPGEAWLEPVRSNMLRLAWYYRGMAWFALLTIFTGLGVYLIDRFGGELSLFGLILFISFGVITTFFTCGLSLAIQAKERPLVVAFGMLFIPPVWLFLPPQYGAEAMKRLESNGLKIGLLGTKRKDILLQLEELQARHEEALQQALAQTENQKNAHKG